VSAKSRASRGVLRTLDVLDDGDIEVVDTRGQESVVVLPVADADAQALIAKVFEGTALPEDAAKVKFINDLRHEIDNYWLDARKSFLSIGRALLAAEERLSKEEYERLIVGADRLLPFGRTVAVQLRAVAKAVEQGRIPKDACPAGYSVAYELSTLSDEDLQVAALRGLIRTDLRRAEIKAFKEEIKAALKALGHRINLVTLQRERALKLRQRERLERELEDINRRLAEIDRILDDRLARV
jgi:hypothetical protein